MRIEPSLMGFDRCLIKNLKVQWFNKMKECYRKILRKNENTLP